MVKFVIHASNNAAPSAFRRGEGHPRCATRGRNEQMATALRPGAEKVRVLRAAKVVEGWAILPTPEGGGRVWLSRPVHAAFGDNRQVGAIQDSLKMRLPTEAARGRHCEARGDEAIQRPQAVALDCFALLAMTASKFGAVVSRRLLKCETGIETTWVGRLSNRGRRSVASTGWDGGMQASRRGFRRCIDRVEDHKRQRSLSGSPR